MALNEQIVIGRKFRKCIDELNRIWLRVSFWTAASDVEFNDGDNAENKVMSISNLLKSLTANGAITEVKIVSELPDDAESNPTTIYLIEG